MVFAFALVFSGISASAQESTRRVPDGFTFAATGDLISPKPIHLDTNANMARLAELFRHSDLGYANQEGAIFDVAEFHGSHAAENGGGTPVSPVQLARDLKAMGITIVSKANNHATDWGAEGLIATLASLDSAGLVQAGSGKSIVEARAPGYVETRHGMAALVSVASTFPPMSVAGPAVQNSGVALGSRPGISALHVRLIHRVSAEDLASLRRVVGNAAYPVIGRDDEVRVGDILFERSQTPGLTWEMQQEDETAILASVREARAKAGFVLFAIHAHQTAGDKDDGPAPYQPDVLHFANEAAAPADPRPADFEPALFHAVIDAGADAVVRTGPHQLSGIEIYKGKPIFYCLGSLFFPFGQRPTFTTAAGETLSFTEDNFETVIPVTTYKGGRASEIRLYPVEIDRSAGQTGGSPLPASPERARRILERLRDLSIPFGTDLRIEDGIGVIRPPA